MRTRRTFHPDRVGRTPARQTPARTERRDMLRGVADDAARSELTMSLDELAREGARRMLAGALEAEVDVYLAAFAELVDEHGHRLVRRKGLVFAGTVATGTGQVEVVRPRVDDRRVDPETGQRQQFQSVILPRWVRRSRKGRRGGAAAVPARAQLQRLRPSIDRAVRLGGGPVGLGGHSAHHPVAGRTRGLRAARPL